MPNYTKKIKLPSGKTIEEEEELHPSPPALALSTSLTPMQLHDVYTLAEIFDAVAEEARQSERNRIFRMGFIQLCREFWRGKRLYDNREKT